MAGGTTRFGKSPWNGALRQGHASIMTVLHGLFAASGNCHGFRALGKVAARPSRRYPVTVKVEIAESLALSWLRHVERCQIVQMNWKPLPAEIPEADLKPLMTQIGEHFKARYGVGVLKGNASAQQLLRQAEIDALGICMKGRHVTKVVAVDIAFHESGLNYGNGDETPARIVKKLLRTAIVLKYVLDAGPGSKVVFATPKASPAVRNRLLEAEAAVRSFADQHGWDYQFDVLFGDRFRDEFYRPVLLHATEVADTSELFMRAYQLHTLLGEG